MDILTAIEIGAPVLIIVGALARYRKEINRSHLVVWVITSSALALCLCLLVPLLFNLWTIDTIIPKAAACALAEGNRRALKWFFPSLIAIVVIYVLVLAVAHCLGVMSR
jgi:hypothetical protein